MKEMKLTLAALALTLVSAIGAQAEAKSSKCYIYLAQPCHNNLYYGPRLGWYVDGDPLGQVNAARCAQRAAEWYNYCGDPLSRQIAYTAFNVITPNGNELTVMYTSKAKSGSSIYGPGSAGRIGVVSAGQ